MRLGGSSVPVGDHHRKAFLHDVDDLGLETEALEPIAQPSGVAQAVFAALRQRADRRDLQLFDKICQVGFATGGGSSESVLLDGLRLHDLPLARLICSALSFRWAAQILSHSSAE